MYVIAVLCIVIATVLISEGLNFRFYRKSQYYKCTGIPYRKLKRDVGKHGEYLVYHNLEHLVYDGSKFLFNVVIPRENGKTTELDVVLLSPKGVFVIESKNYKGWIFGDENQKQWIQTFKNGKSSVTKEKFYNPIMQNKTHVKYLKDLIGMQYPIYSIIAFSDKSLFKDVTVSNRIPLLQYSNLPLEMSAHYNRTHKDLLSSSDIKTLYDKLKSYSNLENTIVNKSVVKETKEITKETNIVLPTGDTKSEKSIDKMSYTYSKTCPKCGGKMVFRNIRKEGQKPRKFYGCSNYPKCKYTEKYIYSELHTT